MQEIIRIELPGRSESERRGTGWDEWAATLVIDGDEIVSLSPSQLDALVAVCREVSPETPPAQERLPIVHTPAGGLD